MYNSFFFCCSDFLTRSYDIGGVISVMALSGLFILMTQHGLEYPKFYEKLYALLTPAVFMAKHRSVFLQVSEKKVWLSHYGSSPSMVDHPFFMINQLLWAEKYHKVPLWKKYQGLQPSHNFVFYKCCSRASHSGPYTVIVCHLCLELFFSWNNHGHLNADSSSWQKELSMCKLPANYSRLNL